VLAMSRYPISLDRPVGNSEDSHFGDLLPDGTAESPATGASQEMLRGRINKVLKTLSYREREIIKLRYGLGDGYSYTLEEVGHIFKVTRERIRQIEAKAVRKLQQPSRSQELVGFLDDLVTTRQLMYRELLELIGVSDPKFDSSPPATYAATCRGRKVNGKPRFETWAYPLTVGQPLPILPLWLTDDLAVSLDLEASYEDACRPLRIA
jgi:hypothetical protein